MSFLNENRFTPSCPSTGNGTWNTSTVQGHDGFFTRDADCQILFKTTAYFFEFTGSVSPEGSVWGCSNDAGKTYTYYESPKQDGWADNYLCAWSPNKPDTVTYAIINGPNDGNKLIVHNVTWGDGEQAFEADSGFTSSAENDLKSLYISAFYSTIASPSATAVSTSSSSSSNSSTAASSASETAAPSSSTRDDTAASASASSTSDMTSSTSIFVLVASILCGIVVVCLIAGLCLRTKPAAGRVDAEVARKKEMRRKFAKLAHGGGDDDDDESSTGSSDEEKGQRNRKNKKKKGKRRAKDDEKDDSDTGTSSSDSSSTGSDSDTEDDRRRSGRDKDRSMGRRRHRDRGRDRSLGKQVQDSFRQSRPGAGGLPQQYQGVSSGMGWY